MSNLIIFGSSGAVGMQIIDLLNQKYVNYNKLRENAILEYKKKYKKEQNYLLLMNIYKEVLRSKINES